MNFLTTFPSYIREKLNKKKKRRTAPNPNHYSIVQERHWARCFLLPLSQPQAVIWKREGLCLGHVLASAKPNLCLNGRKLGPLPTCSLTSNMGAAALWPVGLQHLVLPLLQHISDLLTTSHHCYKQPGVEHNSDYVTYISGSSYYVQSSNYPLC